MPFMLDYECDDGHVTEYLHMGTRDTAPAMINCGGPCQGGPATMKVSAPRIKEINKANSDFLVREKARLTKRSTDHWNKHGKEEAIERTRAMDKKHGLT